MKLPEPISVKALAEEFDLTIYGNPDLSITGLNEIHKVEAGDLMFVDHPKYYQRALESAASVILIDQKTEYPDGKTLLIADQPFEVYNTLMWRYRPYSAMQQMIHPTAQIHKSAILEPGVCIDANVEIGPCTHIQANVVIHGPAVIGEGVLIQSGTIIGTDAFYFKKTQGKYRKWRSGGRVVIGDGVDIGAACTINKGVSGDTVIGRGTKLDCQVHIGHGVVVGEDCLFAAQVGIAGKAIIGDRVTLLGKVGVNPSITIGDDATIMGASVVSKSLPGGKMYMGNPAENRMDYLRKMATLRQIKNQ